MKIKLIYNVIILSIITITNNIIIINISSSEITAEISDLIVNQISFNKTNMTVSNNTEIFKNSTTLETCIMPKCPIGKVCIQVCPESLPPI